jgi:hypothetical protein
MAEADTVRCSRCQGAIWNDLFSETAGSDYRFSCIRCGNIIKVSGCGSCKTSTMKLVHGVETGGPHRPFYRFRCSRCSREVRLQGDVWRTDRGKPTKFVIGR